MAATPGPWKWFHYPDGRKLLASSPGAVIHCPDAQMTVTPADAVLIEAAPDLLQILKTTAGNIRSLGPAGALDGCQMEYRQWLAAVDAAIAKAEGDAR